MEQYTYTEQQKAHLALGVFDRKGDYPGEKMCAGPLCMGWVHELDDNEKPTGRGRCGMVPPVLTTCTCGVSCENANCHVDIGVWHEDEDEAIRMWNALPRTMRWTKEPPTETGIYWFRRGDISMVVKVYRENGELLVLYHGNDEDWDLPEGEWAGPIQEPVE